GLAHLHRQAQTDIGALDRHGQREHDEPRLVRHTHRSVPPKRNRALCYVTLGRATRILRHYCASGWRDGWARAKASRAAQAASAARIFGRWSMGTSNRRALVTCGISATSARVGAAPKQNGAPVIKRSTACNPPSSTQCRYQASTSAWLRPNGPFK